MYYVCIENDTIISILNYEPNVPSSVTVYQITAEEHEFLKNKTHHFSISDGIVQANSQEQLDQAKLEAEKNEARANLSNSDWKIMRYIREKALNIELTLSESEYLALERQRQEWVDLINQQN